MDFQKSCLKDASSECVFVKKRNTYANTASLGSRQNQHFAKQSKRFNFDASIFVYKANGLFQNRAFAEMFCD